MGHGGGHLCDPFEGHSTREEGFPHPGVDEGGNDVKVVASPGCVAECPGHHLASTRLATLDWDLRGPEQQLWADNPERDAFYVMPSGWTRGS